PVTASNQSNPSAGVQEQFDAEKAGEENIQQYVLFPLWYSSFKDPQNTDSDATFEVKEPEFEVEKPESEVHVSPSRYRNLSLEFKDFSDNSINEVNAASTPVPTVGEYSYMDTSQYPDDLNVPALEDITYSDNEEYVGAEADFTNLETTITVSPILTTRVHKDHTVTQIIEEPKRVHQALKNPSWIEAMQEELLQFKLQKVWVLVDLPNGKRAIGTKWIFKNKKDERGIVVRNKARLVAQGHIHEEGIDYEEILLWMIRRMHPNRGIIAKINVDEDVILEEVDAEKDVKLIKKNADVQGRVEESQAKVYHIDLEHADKVLSMHDDEPKPAQLQEVIEVVTTAKLMTEVVTDAAPITAATITAAPSAKGVVIRDPEETATPSTIIQSEPKSKDKGKGFMVEEPKPLKKQAQIEQDEVYARELEAKLNKNINWDDVIEWVKEKGKQDNVVLRYQALNKKPQTEAQARLNMMVYLKNMTGLKMDYFKGMSYDNIRPIFEKFFNSNVAFLEKSKEQLEEEESRALKRQSESLEEKAAKKQKLDEERRLEDVMADSSRRFESSKPKNFSDDFLLTTLKYMFEKPDVEAQV
nr:putative ribonuclease H-like domain-containing protein [Tanacetum cinerariifolium]